jgi:hypothetical protein
MKINMIGPGFQHDVCSSAFNKNKYAEWVKGDHPADTSIYIDDAILGSVNVSKQNYGWLCESSEIKPHVTQEVISDIEHYRKKFLFIFTQDMRIVEMEPSFFKFAFPPAMPWIQNKKIYPKSKLVSMIASNKKLCRGHLFRQQIISKFQNKVDHFGRGFGSRELPWSINTEYGIESGKILGLRDYMFSIAMENNNIDYAFCEKTTDCFATGTIPIFWGGKKITEFFDERGIIFLDDLDSIGDLNKELYYSKIEYVKNNLDLLKKLITSEDYIYLNYLKGR